MVAKLGESVRAFARRVGVSHPSVIWAIKKGHITPLADGTLDPEAARAQWEARRDPSRKTSPGRGGGSQKTDQEKRVSETYQTARAAREVFDSKTREAKYNLLIGTLLLKSDVEKTAFEAGRRVRDRLMTVASRVGPVVAGVSDPAECSRIIEVEIRHACEELADKVIQGEA